MTDASVPLAVAELEQIVEVVAHNLYAKWAEEGRFTEDEVSQAAHNSVDDTVFVINNYMQIFNDVMLNKTLNEKTPNNVVLGLD
jgi:hypothetical protein